MKPATIVFHGDLSLLLRRSLNAHKSLSCSILRKASIKDVIESLGPPHTEVGLILINNQERGFEHILGPGEAVAVYPQAEPYDVSKSTLLRPRPFPTLRFIVDVNVGRLALLLRLIGYDTAFQPSWNDDFLVHKAQEEERVILSRDRALLKRSIVEYGRFLRSVQPREQLLEILLVFGLQKPFAVFSRCLRCNEMLQPVSKHEVLPQLKEKTRLYYHDFSKCPGCHRVYWRGPHHEKMVQFLEASGCL